MQYSIKSVPSDNTQALEDLLNEMSAGGWDLYSMHEVENDDGFQYNCIFASENSKEDDEDDDDIVNIKTFKSQMEKMLSSSTSPYESCQEIQDKIQEQRKKIVKIKTQLEAQLEAPVSKNRKHLNDDMSRAIKELEDLKQSLKKAMSPDLMYSKIRQEKLAIALSEETINLVDPDKGAVLVSETVKVRQKIAEDLGYVIPKIVFEDDDNLNPYEFTIKIRGLDVASSYVYPDFTMFFEEDLKLTKKIKGAIYTVDEISGRKIVWIDNQKTKDFWENGLTASEYVSRLLTWTLIKNIDELLDYSDINRYMEIVGEKNMFLIENIIPDFISVAELRYLLVNLLREEISIKDIVYIFEKINDYSDEESKEDLLDKIRLALSRYISKKIADKDGLIRAFEVSDKTYEKIFGKLDTEDNIVRVEGAQVQKIAQDIQKISKEFGLGQIVVLAPIEIRHMLFMVLSQFIAHIKVIAKEEILNEYTIELLGEV